MVNPIVLDADHCQAIRQEVGERLQGCLGLEAELPANLEKKIAVLQQSQSPSIVPPMRDGRRSP